MGKGQLPETEAREHHSVPTVNFDKLLCVWPVGKNCWENSWSVPVMPGKSGEAWGS